MSTTPTGSGSSASRPTGQRPYGRRGNSIVRYLDESYDNVVLVGGFSKSYSSLLAFMALPTGLKNHLKVAAAALPLLGPVAHGFAGHRPGRLPGQRRRGRRHPASPGRQDGQRPRPDRRARPLHPELLGTAHHRAAAGRARRHRYGRPLPLRPGDLRDPGRLPPGAPVPGRLPDPDHRGQRRRARSSSSTRCWASSPSDSRCSGAPTRPDRRGHGVADRPAPSA